MQGESCQNCKNSGWTSLPPFKSLEIIDKSVDNQFVVFLHSDCVWIGEKRIWGGEGYEGKIPFWLSLTVKSLHNIH